MNSVEVPADLNHTVNPRLATPGAWLSHAPISESRTLEALETQLEAEDRTGFFQFLRRSLTWLPEERATAKELLEDPWLKNLKP